MSTVMAGQAVRPVCPRCSRPVRSGVELQAGLRDLVDVLALSEALGSSAESGEQALYETVMAVLRQAWDELEVELQGGHRTGPHGCATRPDGAEVLRRWLRRGMRGDLWLVQESADTAT
jgi:hypothetical protein